MSSATLSKRQKVFKALLFAIIATIFLANPTVAVGNANNFYFKDFTADYYLSRDDEGVSHMKVVEQLTAVFPSQNQNHGFTRVIPFTNNDGKNLTMASDKNLEISVERNGVTEKIDNIEAADGYFIVYIGDADSYVTGEQHYTLTYEFENLIMDFGDWQELYWDANGNNWQQRFDQIAARVHLSDDISEHFTGNTSCYVGTYGSNGADRCHTEISDDLVEFSAKNLVRYETLTFDLEFEPDTFTLALPKQNFLLVVLTVIVALLNIALVVLMIFIGRAAFARRKAYRDIFLKPEYTPLRDMTVAEMAKNYLGKGLKGDPRVATLLNLAVTHRVELIKTEHKNFFGKMIPQWKIRLKSLDLTPEETIVLQILAGSKAELQPEQEIEIKTRTSNRELVSLAQSFNTTVDKAIEKKGLVTDKKARTRAYAPVLAICAALWVVFGSFAVIMIVDQFKVYAEMVGGAGLLVLFVILIYPFAVSSSILSIFAHKYLTPSDKGFEYSRYLEGMYEYIRLAEAERLKVLQSVKGADTSHQGVVKLYEKLLPYAVLFGLEKSWLNELSRYYEFDDVAHPNWYVGVGIFSAQEFSTALMAASSSITTSIAHSTTSNSSSGFSGGGGGGFSGGGGGGGGGGGW